VTRVEDVNEVRDLLGFLTRWANRTEAQRCPALPQARSENGNINLRSSADCYESFLLTRWHPSFESSIEPGVRDLVLALVREWDCVTYTSCEGHPTQRSVPMRLRHVGLVARSPSEYRKLERSLRLLVALTNGSGASDSVRLRLLHRVISTDDAVQAPGLDLLFDSSKDSPPSYAEEVQRLYSACLSHLAEAGMGMRHGDTSGASPGDAVSTGTETEQS